jgi:hypothetical protein
LAAFEKIIERLAMDLDAAHRICGVLSIEEKEKMLDDLRYLLMDNIADKIRFDFYAPHEPEGEWFRSVYRRDGGVSQKGSVGGIDGLTVENIAFDVSIEFMAPFLSLEKSCMDHLLGNTEFVWHTHDNPI